MPKDYMLVIQQEKQNPFFASVRFRYT